MSVADAAAANTAGWAQQLAVLELHLTCISRGLMVLADENWLNNMGL